MKNFRISFIVALSLISLIIYYKFNKINSDGGNLQVDATGRIEISVAENQYSSSIVALSSLEFTRDFAKKIRNVFGDKDIEWSTVHFNQGYFYFAALANKGEWSVKYENKSIPLKNGDIYLFKISKKTIDYINDGG